MLHGGPEYHPTDSSKSIDGHLYAHLSSSLEWFLLKPGRNLLRVFNTPIKAGYLCKLNLAFAAWTVHMQN
jgi:hypothetical protein